MGRMLIIIVIVLAVISAVFWHHQTVKKSEQDSTGMLSEKLQKYSGSSFNPDIRVHLTTRKTIPFQITSDYEIRSLDNHQVLGSGKKLPKTTIRQSKGKIWIGQKKYDSKRIEITVKKSPAIWVRQSYYRGRIRLYSHSSGRIEVVNVLPMKNYIASVIDSEMPGHFPDEARAAQAIIARTYALYQMEKSNPRSHYDLYNSTRSQKYLGYQYRDKRGRLLAGESSSSKNIADETQGVVCTHKGDLFCTYYSAVCGGQTDDGKIVFSDAAPPVKSVQCQWCKDARYFQWSARMGRKSFNRVVLRYLKSKGRSLKTVKLVKSLDSLDEFTVSDGSRSVVIKTRELKPYLSSVNLLSPKYRIQAGSENVEFKGFGHGHCVGFCQWGSRGLAKTGMKTEEILQYYYPGSNLVNLSGKVELADRKIIGKKY